MGLFKEFKEFALKGNVVDLAVAVIIGTAFGRIIQSLVNDIIMPVFGKGTGTHFGELFYSLDDIYYPTLAAAREAGAPVIAYGSFIQNILDFFIIAFSIFFVIRLMNKLKRKQIEQSKKEESTRDQILLEEIRDILKSKS